MSSTVKPYKRNFRNCPVCRSIKHTQFKTFSKNNNLYVVSLCEECGFVFQNLLFSKEHYHSLPCSYPKDYWSHSFKRAKYIYDFCSDYFELMNTVNILDIGAGRGGVLMNLNIMILNSGYSTGITLEAEKSYMAETLHHFDFEDDKLVDEFVKNNEHKFNLIVMSHILEHFINPLKAIQNVRKLLAPDGIIYIEVPSLYFAEYRINSVWTPEHLSYFTSESLTTLMRQVGFDDLEFIDSMIWGNIKSIWQNVDSAERIVFGSKYVEKNYNVRRFRKFIQRMKHKLGYKYEANI